MKRSYIMKVYSIEKADYWRKKIEEQKNSGLNMSVFCSENNLSLDRLKYWKYRFRDEAAEKLIEIQKSDRKSGSFSQAEKQTKDPGQFLPVCIHRDSLMQEKPSFQIEGPFPSSGLSIRIGRVASLHLEENFDSRLLGRVLEVISQI